MTTATEPLTGWWSITAEDSLRMSAEQFAEMRDRLAEATEQGRLLVVIDGIELVWHDARCGHAKEEPQ